MPIIGRESFEYELEVSGKKLYYRRDETSVLLEADSVWSLDYGRGCLRESFFNCDIRVLIRRVFLHLQLGSHIGNERQELLRFYFLSS